MGRQKASKGKYQISYYDTERVINEIQAMLLMKRIPDKSNGFMSTKAEENNGEKTEVQKTHDMIQSMQVFAKTVNIYVYQDS